MAGSFYITTPIYYVNDVPHIGHAYTTVAADVLARYARLRGEDVFFLTGLDEHGQKVQQAAAKAGIDPKQYCDQLAPKFQTLWKRLNISNDAFIRTTDPQHKRFVQTLLQNLFDKDLIYRAEYTGWYCTFDERFWTEKDVVDGLCPDCKRPVERLSESNYFFRMSRYQQQLLTHIQSHPEYIRPHTRANEVLGFLQKPLEDLSISRPKSRLSWGIELPFDHHYVTYVWFDALANYLSALEYLTPQPSLDRYWPATLHLVGKDILTTHAVYWSTILMALQRPLPRTIFAHGWWTVDGEKMSKSRGNVVDPNAVIDEFGSDAFRYFLLREVPFGHDGDFSRAALVGRINSDLANDLGNLLSRTVALIERFAGGKIPEPEAGLDTELDRVIRQAANDLHGVIEGHLAVQNLEFAKALEAIGGLVQLGNQYIDKTAPWVLAKKPENRPRLNTVLYNAAEALRFVGLSLYPFMPQAAEELKKQLGAMLNFSKPLLSGEVSWGGLLPGTTVTKGNSLFPRVDPDKSKGGEPVSDQIPAGQPSSPAGPGASPAPEQITIEDFQKVQLQVAKIVSAERVPKSEKLLKLQVDLGGEQRQIVAGIGKRYEPEALIGRRVVVVSNLKPAKLMGVESQGMVLAAGDKDVIGLVSLEGDPEPGTKVK
ncbi:MAG TPA: methionine--tRNA ligase [Nitrospiraceae bacterium]|jgi:methionyl-tRNA synthetase|nr:methionine--tRNA ligase [Nitrospiraceae bacterium]